MLLILNKNRTVSDIWCMTDVIFIFYCGLFLPFYPHNSPKNKNFKKMNKKSGDITIFHKCTKNHDHLLACFWDMACDGCNYYFSFGAMFCPFTPVTAQKMKMKKKMKKRKTPEDIIILQKCTKNHDHMLYCSWDMACDICNCYFSFWAIFCTFILLTVQKIEISKKWKKGLEISYFTYVYQKLWWDNVWFLRYGARWTDGWTDGKKWHHLKNDN